MYGNVAPGGGVAKITGKEGETFTGVAKVYDSEPAMLDEDAYKRIYVLLCKHTALYVGEEFDLAEAKQGAQEEWASDSHGGEGITRELFMDAIFEIADMWCEDIDEDECVARCGAAKFDAIAQLA